MSIYKQTDSRFFSAHIDTRPRQKNKNPWRQRPPSTGGHQLQHIYKWFKSSANKTTALKQGRAEIFKYLQV